MDLARIRENIQLLPLAVSLAAFFIHILLHHVLSAYEPVKPSRKEVDYTVWSWISLGLALGWIFVFWEIMPLGDISISVLTDRDTTKRLMTAYITYHIVILPYQWISSLLFAEAPVTRAIRKTIPAALLAYAIVVDTKPSTVIMLVSWALQHGLVDTFIDVGVMERVRGVDNKFIKVAMSIAILWTVRLFLLSAVPALEDGPAKLLKVAAALYVVCELAFELQPALLT